MAAKTRSALIKSKSGLVVKRGRKNEEGPARMTRNATVAQETLCLSTRTNKTIRTLSSSIGTTQNDTPLARTQSSFFRKLPAEIRLMIYDYALGTGTVDKSTGTRVIIAHMHRDWFKL
ncbi:hypothetical protein AUEXF2481DRAFT_8416 [Aureobasidium subglaciale EXF-2481]|uniref:DUF7730 domain-containing protein n=1 Tax=Aureobasidium subglaciale (strain EXF-2481) TaxID=1043005 RepID=A0A074Y171_AURSE|nr:uncharacterized protein AUEXF2481DRAFT_8416 [Aureobasidium subglaciale EXF-2481]KEQ91548.1 hypothetical protein AUEXF2481DRAFT_8416 [Aureobasidium subglaciale EXF-2481]